ncbi:hypothetical protein F5H01DRAFT_352735 [Linnemannia elongata]|nr:hypothetical protein F5H01DRAFT_352735 [Linnemannia elongata]
MTSVLFYNPDNTPDELACSSPPSHNDANCPWPKPNSPHDNQSWKKDGDTKPPKIPSLARLNILQGFSILGGAGSVAHEIQAMEYQKTLALASSEGRYRPRSCTFNSTDRAEVPTTTDVTTTEKETTEGENTVARGGGEQLWPWSWSQKLQSITTGSRGTMKRYRITIEELPGEVSADGSALVSTSASATSAADVSASEAGVGAGLEEVEAVKKVATTTAMMPMGVVEWLLNVSYDKPYGFRAPAVEEKKGGDESAVAVVVPALAAFDEVTPQVPLPDHDLLSSSSVPVAVVAAGTVAPPTAESPDRAGPEPVATKIESPVMDQLAVTPAAPVPAKPSSEAAASSSVLVNKVMEVRPSWDNNNSISQDTSSRTREWPPLRHQQQRRPSESFTQTTITRPDGTIESKTVTFNRQSGVTETHTRIQRPDGSFLESSTHRINPSLREAQEKEQKEQEQQPVPSTRHEGGNPYRNHLNRVAAQQQQQQQQQNDAEVVAATTASAIAASTSTPPTPPLSSSTLPSQHRPSFRERWARRRQEHREFLEDLRAERERERSFTSQDHEQERGRQDDRRRERRQELRDAEARQREATAAAYGFVPSSSSSASESASSSSNGSTVDREREDHRHHHRDRLRRRGRKDEDEEKEYDGEGRQQQYRSRSWPPKGYLKRQEREQQEQQEPRHNV